MTLFSSVQYGAHIRAPIWNVHADRCFKSMHPDQNEVEILFPAVNSNPGSERSRRGDASRSADRLSSTTDPCLQAGIMPAPIEIFDSDPAPDTPRHPANLPPVWSCVPSHCACIFSGLQVSSHDSAPRKANVDKMNHYPQFDGTVSSDTFSQPSRLSVVLLWAHFYVPTMATHCSRCEAHNNKTTQLNPSSSIIYSL